MAGFRTFATGEVLTAANVNNFLMKQSVMVFADAAARTSALGAEVAEGMLTYNEDTAQLEVFDGSAFVETGGGGLVQVVSATDSTIRSTSSATFVTATLSAAITPNAIGNTVIVIWSADAEIGIVPGVDASGSIRVTEGGTPVEGMEIAGFRTRAAQASIANALRVPFTIIGFYTTVGTSSVTFQTEFRRIDGDITLFNQEHTGRLVLAEVKV